MVMTPTLGHVAQLEPPPTWVLRDIESRLHKSALGPHSFKGYRVSPTWVLRDIESHLHKSAPGPHSWCSNDDSWQLKEGLGLNCSFKHIGIQAKAIQSRVLHCDSAFTSRVEAKRIYNLIQTKINTSDRIGVKWPEWYTSYYLHNLFSTERLIKNSYGGLEMLWRNYNPKLNLESPSVAEANRIQHKRNTHLPADDLRRPSEHRIARPGGKTQIQAA